MNMGMMWTQVFIEAWLVACSISQLVNQIFASVFEYGQDIKHHQRNHTWQSSNASSTILMALQNLGFGIRDPNVHLAGYNNVD